VSVPAIEAEKLTKFYGRHRGIEDVTFAVAPGEVFGFLGAWLFDRRDISA
jgi:ABC-2 type transport system ATP-binding protein